MRVESSGAKRKTNLVSCLSGTLSPLTPISLPPPPSPPSSLPRSLSICLCLCLSVCPSVCLSAWLAVSPSHFGPEGREEVLSRGAATVMKRSTTTRRARGRLQRERERERAKDRGGGLGGDTQRQRIAGQRRAGRNLGCVNSTNLCELRHSGLEALRQLLALRCSVCVRACACV